MWVISHYYKESALSNTTQLVLLIDLQLYRTVCPWSLLEVLPCDPYLFFNVERMKIVVVGQFSTSRHVFKRIQSNPINTVNRPAGKIQSNIPSN